MPHTVSLSGWPYYFLNLSTIKKVVGNLDQNKKEEVDGSFAKNEFFPDKEWNSCFHATYADESRSVTDAVYSIINQMQKQTEPIEDVINGFEYGTAPQFLENVVSKEPKYRYNMSDADWKKWQDEYDAWRDAVIAEMNKYADQNNLKWYALEYSDGGGCGETDYVMEKGGVFDSMIARNRGMMFNNH